MHPVIGEASALLQQANEVDWAQVPAGELAAVVLEVQAMRARLDALTGAVVGRFDQSGVWAEDRCRSAKGWLRHHGRMSGSAAGRQVTLSRRQRELPGAAAALVAGRIRIDHVAVLARARTTERAAAYQRHEPVLVEQAATLQFADFERAVAYWCQLVDANEVEAEARDRHTARSLYLSATTDGVGVLDATLEPLGRATVGRELARLERIEFEADWKQARDRYGDDATAQHLGRTPAQRRHDALVRMAERSASLADGAPVTGYLSYIHIDWVTFTTELAAAVADGCVPAARAAEVSGLTAGELADLVARPVGAGGRPGPRMCELSDGTPILPSQALPLVLRGEVRRVVFGATGNVLDLGRRSRFFTGTAREGITVRDRHCREPGCDRPAEDCQVDHIRPWCEDGPTDHDNGRLLCGPANRARERRRRRRQDPPS